MAPAMPDDSEQWRLGIELGEHHEVELRYPADEPERDLSNERLGRTLQVLTAESLGWFAVAALMVVTRVVALGMRPLNPHEASGALFELALANGGSAGFAAHPSSGGWVHLIEAAIFAVAGPSDFTARLIFALAGILLLAVAFFLRRYIGRAGALAFGAMITVSPTMTYFSRDAVAVMPAIALALTTIAVFLSLRHAPSMRKAAILGVTVGLMLAAGVIGLVTGALMIIALALMGLWELVVGRHSYLRIRVWLDRYSRLAATAIVVAVGVWVLSELTLPGRLRFNSIAASVMPILRAGKLGDFLGGFHFYLPGLALYDFLIVIVGVIGLLAIIGARIRSRFAAWCLLWALLSIAFYMWTPKHADQNLVAILVPVALVGALGIDWLHHADAWSIIRYPLAALLLLTVYVQVLHNFYYYAPDASEAPWARHANLYWGADATTIQTRRECADASNGIAPADATVFFAGGDSPVIRWYLRGLRPVSNIEAATVVAAGQPYRIPSAAGATQTHRFDAAIGWSPQAAGLDGTSALHYLFSAQIWGKVSEYSVVLAVRPPLNPAPTVILAPG